PPLAARLPLEVLDRVGHVGGPSLDARLLETAVEQSPRRPHERLPGPVLLVARLLADEHHLRGGPSGTEDGLRGGFPERARAAARGRLPERGQGEALRQQRRDVAHAPAVPPSGGYDASRGRRS